MRIRFFPLLIVLVVLSVAASAGCRAGAQVLARPGWAGAGVTAEPWWRRAVFYRIQPALFQDSGASGKGDLRGIMQRLDYLNRLGVDAIVLVPPFADEDFGELAAAAGAMRVRVLVQLSTATPAEARHWLTQGAAGIFLEARTLQTAPSPETLRDLRRLTDSFPGERILLASGVSAASGLDARARPQLSVTADFGSARPNAAQLRAALESALPSGGGERNPLLELSGLPGASDAEASPALDRVLALMLFASRTAVLFDAGRELGLRSPDGRAVAMQWTPANVSKAAPTPVAAEAPAPSSGEVYGAYRPYVPPARFTLPRPKAPEVVESALAPPADLNTLPGFTTGALPPRAAANGASANAAVEEYDPGSLLMLFRRLIALHHGNWTLRNGTESVLNRDAQNTLVWIRRAPAGTSTTASVVAAANLSAQPVELALGSELKALRLRGGLLRPLLGVQGAATQASADHLTLAPGAIFAGELVHGSAISEGYGSARHRRR